MNQNHQVYKGHINAMDIVMGENTEIDALPKLKEYINDNGGSKICLDWCLGICSFIRRGKCDVRHAVTEYITDTFSHELCQLLVPGVHHVLMHGPPEQGPTKKKHRG